MISAGTGLYGVVGDPVGHSLSPALHNAALRAAGVDGVYLALPVRPSALGAAIAGARALGVRGLNVTIPHKVAVISHLDGLTPVAEAIGAVNTIFWRGDRLEGHNTDAEGYRAMLEAGSTSPSVALVLGAGGAARAVVRALADRKIRVRVAARRIAAARELLADLGSPRDQAVSWDEREAALPEVQLVVNATSIGMRDPGASPLESLAGLPEGASVHDLVYAPSETRLLELARERGLATVGGAVMLVHQAAAAFALWTGQAAPLAVMERALEQALVHAVS